MHKGIDTCAKISTAAAAQLKAEGFDFVARYLVPESGTLASKALTRAEAERISVAGLRILAVWETTGTRAKGGAEAGLADGARAAALARAMEIPAGAVIYFAVDYDARSTSDLALIGAYLRAARSRTGDYEVGVYGTYLVVTTISYNTPVTGYWQCVGGSGGAVSPLAQTYQALGQDAPECVALAKRLGFAVDIDYCLDMDAAGMWRYKEDAEMTDQQIYEAVQRYADTLPVPDWARDELDEAIDLGITDGSRPTQLVPRYQAAILAKRAVRAALRESNPMDEKTFSGLLTDD